MKYTDLAIIGGGPAGLSAAAFALGVQLDVTLIAPDLGGKLGPAFGLEVNTQTRPIWGAELVNQLAGYVQSQPVTLINAPVQAVRQPATGEFVIELADSDRIITARSVIVATGVKPQRLFVPGEQELVGKGVSYSALSHAARYQGRDVLVVGHSERALVALLKLAGLARLVYWLPAGLKEGTEEQIRQVKSKGNISSLEGWRLTHIHGTQAVAQAEIVNGYSIRYLEVEGVFIELGWLANTEFLGELIPLEEESGHIPINQRCQTVLPGLFAAGDVSTAYAEQVPVAVGEGMKAAISAWEYCVVAPSR